MVVLCFFFLTNLSSARRRCFESRAKDGEGTAALAAGTSTVCAADHH